MSQDPQRDMGSLEQAIGVLESLIGTQGGIRAEEVFQEVILRALATLERGDRVKFSVVKAQLKRAKISLRDLDVSMQAYRPPLRVVHQYDSAIPDGTASSYLDDAPLPDLIIPTPYGLRDNATVILHYDNEDPEKPPRERALAYAPILITGRLQHIEDHTEYFRLEWKRGQVWHFRYVDRGIAFNAQKLLELATHGFPVATENAANVAQYLHQLEAENLHTIPTAHMATRLGWQGKSGQHGFLSGRTLIRQGNSPVTVCDLEETRTTEWKTDWIAFQGATPGDDQLVQGFHARGTLQGWKDAVSVITQYPKVLMGLYASFAPPLLELLRVPNFATDWSGRTSAGKTTTLRVVASPWGCPDERLAGESIVFSWFMTRVWPERAAAVLNGLPLILDESKLAAKEIVPAVLYMVTNGIGRGRGAPRGLATSKRWHTILFSSGEGPITAMSEDGGSRMRCLAIRGYPFGTKNPEMMKLVSELNASLQMHYGHAGPQFVQWLQRRRHCLPEWEARYRKSKHMFMTSAQDEAAMRLSDYAALIELAGELVHEALDLPWKFTGAIPLGLWRAIVQEASGAAGDQRALRHILSWATGHQQAFEGRHHHNSSDGTPRPPPGGWAGRWAKGDQQSIAWLPHVLDAVLEEGDFDPTAIKELWRENGWLELEKGRQTYLKRTRLFGEMTRLVTINLATADVE
jgi:hypothetical protein